MIPQLDTTVLPAQAQKSISTGAPARLQMMAAKGVLPGLPPDAIVSVIVALCDSPTEAVAAQAVATLADLPGPVLRGALDADLQPAVIYALAQHYVDAIDVLDPLLHMARLPIEAVEYLAQAGGEMTVELVATNEERVLQNPQLIAHVYLNENSRMSTANRLIELAVRNGIECKEMPAWKEVSQAVQGELVAEPSGAPLPEDQQFWEVRDLAEELTDATSADAYIENEDGTEDLKRCFEPLYVRLGAMGVAQKIRRAILGSKEERMMLIREQNRVIATAAARSPLLQEPEVVLVSRNQCVAQDVLRIIGTSPEWLKSYQVKRNLVCNSKTPVAIATRLIPQLRESDLRKLARSKNIPAAVQMAARRHLDRRKH